MDKQQAKELFDYRIRLLRDATDFKKTERVPIMGNTQQWIYLDAGYTIMEVSRNYIKCYDSGRQYFQKYKVDLMYGAGCIRNPTRIYDALGQSSAWAAVGNENNINAIFEDELLKADEYDEMIENYEKTVWEKVFQRQFPNLKNFNVEQIVNAAKETKENGEAKLDITRLLREEFGAADPIKIISCSSGFINDLMNTHRGIKGLAIDLRRRPQKVEELCAKRDELARKSAIARIEQTGEGYDMEEPWDVMMGFLAHTILNEKQFEKFIFPNLKSAAECCEKNHKQMHLNTEGSILRFADFFNDFKKGTLNCIIEMDDPFEIRKQIPNVAITGGLAVDVMGKGTQQECIDMAKKAIDELGSNGGLWLSPNKFVTYEYDMKAENLKAVCDFVVDYRG